MTPATLHKVAVQARFWSKVVEMGDCHIWQGAVNPRGYGVFPIGGVTMNAHRAAWFLEYGPIPGKLVVMHTCDVPLCVNLDHLVLGTQRANVRDMDRKGRRPPESLPHPSGEAHPRARLTDAQVTEIKEAVAMGEKQSRVALRFGISPTHVSSLVRGRRRAA